MKLLFFSLVRHFRVGSRKIIYFIYSLIIGGKYIRINHMTIVTIP